MSPVVGNENEKHLVEMLKAKYSGNDNYQRERSTYLTKIVSMSNTDLMHETNEVIYQSARCANALDADCHWMVNACYDVCESRPDERLYQKAHDLCFANHTS
jgi:hypothetical protein